MLIHLPPISPAPPADSKVSGVRYRIACKATIMCTVYGAAAWYAAVAASEACKDAAAPAAAATFQQAAAVSDRWLIAGMQYARAEAAPASHACARKRFETIQREGLGCTGTLRSRGATLRHETGWRRVCQPKSAHGYAPPRSAREAARRLAPRRPQLQPPAARQSRARALLRGPSRQARRLWRSKLTWRRRLPRSPSPRRRQLRGSGRHTRGCEEIYTTALYDVRDESSPVYATKASAFARLLQLPALRSLRLLPAPSARARRPRPTRSRPTVPGLRPWRRRAEWTSQ